MSQCMNLAALSQIREKKRVFHLLKNAVGGLRYSMEWVVNISLHLLLMCIIGVFIWIFPIRKKMVGFTWR